MSLAHPTVPASFSAIAPPRAVSASPVSEPHFAGRSAAIRRLVAQLDRFAPFDHTNILIEGESGTGKSYAARYLHLRSPRAKNPFHQVVLSTLDDNLAASDLFGHLSGAYTDARQSRPGHWVTANGGTLFLDEIGKSSPAVQRKLLHAVEHHEVWPVGGDRGVRLDVRLIAATNIPLEQLVKSGGFLIDLAARLCSFRILLPALRDRRDDIPALVTQFIELRAARCGHPVRNPGVHPELMAALSAADWPNNLRELDATIQRLLIEGVDAEMLTLGHCVDELAYLCGPSMAPDVLTPDAVKQRMSELKSVTATARSLGVSRWTVYRYLERAGPESAARRE